MRLYLFISAFAAATIAQQLTPIDVGCPVFSLMEPGPGCHYEYEKNERGCDMPHLVCDNECGPNEELRECGSMCPMTCEDVRNPQPKPCPFGCLVNECQCKKGYALDENQRCVLERECLDNEPIGCPMFKLVAPARGCHYEFDRDERGCKTNPHQVCDDIGDCPVYDMAPPRPGCHYEFEQNERGCDVPREVCDDDFPGCPEYTMIPSGPGCHYEFDQDENGCDVNPREVCDKEKRDADCAAVSCVRGQECRVIDGVAQCAPPCPQAMPPPIQPGCRVEMIDNEDGCPMPQVFCDKNSDCAAVSCIVGQECRIIDGEAQCIDANCPELVVPPMLPGCRLETTRDGECPAYDVKCAEPCSNEGCADGRVCRVIDGIEQCADPCPQAMLPPIPDNCHLEQIIDDQGCPMPNVVCDVGCEAIDCFDNQVCRSYMGDAMCVDVNCPNIFVPPTLPGCRITVGRDANDCPTYEVSCDGAQDCAAVSCPFGQDCRIIDGQAQCVESQPCPMYMPPIVEDGCHLESTVDENGCPRPKVVCNETSSCGVNEELKTCGSACPETCEQVRTGVYPMCIRKCIPNVCQCKQGFALDKHSRCVPREQCSSPAPVKCGPHEELKQCGTMCPLTCEQHLSGEPVMCIEMCQLNVCQCIDGYALNGQGRCVKLEHCRRHMRLPRPGKGKGRQ